MAGVKSAELKKLYAEFPKDAVSWRAGHMNKEGDSAMALAYIDARDVMERLDQICGVENWKDRYEVHDDRTICYLALRINDEWIEKADGAGDTNFEAQKGSISDAFKRAAVRWGIGRYLYDLPTPWVPCKTWKDSNGKLRFDKFTSDPWGYVKTKSSAEKKRIWEGLKKEIEGKLKKAKNVEECRALFVEYRQKLEDNQMRDDTYIGLMTDLIQKTASKFSDADTGEVKEPEKEPENQSQDTPSSGDEFDTVSELLGAAEEDYDNCATGDELEKARERFIPYYDHLDEEDLSTIEGLYEARMNIVEPNTLGAG